MKLKILITAIILLICGAAIFRIAMSDDAIASPSRASALVNDDMKGWSKASRIAAQMMMKKYGEPAEKTTSMMMWNNTGQWKKTIVYAKEFKHEFPMPHTDVMEQYIDYSVPADKFDELAMFDGSVVCNRTNGEISARCDKEEANFLAINLANDIVKNNKDVNSAREFYAESVKEMVNGGKPAYTQKLQFNVCSGNTEDADKASPVITQDDIMKAKKMMEMQEKEIKELGMENEK
jgi:hypothetical protein